jgi:beta-galactosidase/beta-glucuronidase
VIKQPFNDDWRWRPKRNPFLEMTGPPNEWQEVTLPHDALIGTERGPDVAPGPPTGFYPGGVFEYVRTYRHSAPPGSRVEVEFDGVYRGAMVYVNGVLAGQRPSGYFPFRVRIDPFLREGDNEIRVECRNHLDARWYAGAGLYREVALLVGGPLHVAAEGVLVSTPDVADASAVVDLVTTVENDSALLTATSVVAEVIAPGGEILAFAETPFTAHPVSRAAVRQRLTVPEPLRWDLESPWLYTCRTRLMSDDQELDRAETTFGIRTLQWDSKHGLRLNGEVLKLRGGCVHHDNGVLGAATFGRAEERRVELLKAAGYNAIRSAHNPISSAMLDACDRLGMLVMDEAYDTWTSPKSDFDYSSELPTWWREDLTSMVLRDINHPSVVIYSIGNEIPEIGDPWGARLGRDMVAHIKSLDRSRPVTNGINPFFAFQADVRAMRSAAPGSIDSLGINTLMAQLAEAGPAAVASEAVKRRIDE